MPRILAISSQVARGHVGLSAIVPTLQAMGHDVVALPTILLSNHPGHATFAGERVSPDLLRRMLDALDANRWLGEIDAVLTGYLPSVEHVAFARETLERVEVRSPGFTYLCDPVIGDDPKGVYIAMDAAEAIRDRLVPIAGTIKCNRFELQWLSGLPVTTAAEAEAAVRRSGWRRAVITSLADPPQHIENLLIERGSITGMCRVERRAGVPNGTGDVLSALLLGHHLFGALSPADVLRASVNGLDQIVEASAGHDELQLVANLEDAIFGLASVEP